ncbi:nitroreductase family deazaflavin-dependent oxidoreductase [Kribbella sandramycini]|uniref:Deazaflavin-dependent oxidoreductase (Nitroreductase family) n=1 Tax=Kribbella sandramycini TaxID=60450 RepID=A0A7Y4KVP8_9ACTN|nr:nitroreductase family deazaflavin-dependent oxidoreductase [Kribbella sandramycini]MBB6567897.1 deazaflavin-dependent oxidoreductase (nitroreductase family) [Kribbella sandramycini]NOL39508.1 nitroreductase family deazaflavin-dependent oxidoreductase [Kribbella sandramycini]
MTTDEYVPSTSDFARGHVDQILEAGTTDVADVMGLKIVVLTMRGAKSGKIRKTPVMRVERDGVYCAVASLGGAPKNPVWYYNLKADPNVTVQDGDQTFELVAREIDGAEYDEWWELAVAAYPPYEEYKTKTTRKMPFFLLEPAS